MSKMAERYAHAAASSNLKCDEYHFDADVLMAVAMAGGLSAQMVRVKFLHDASAYKVLLFAWRDMVARKAKQRRWPAHINPAAVAKVSLDYWLSDQCDHCNGTGFPMMKNVPTRGVKVCPVCEGTGRQPLNCSRQQREQALDMYTELCSTFDRALLKVGRLLKS